jgi:hypothetical protein
MPAYGPGGDVRSGVIRQQDPVLVAALSVFTCGLYSAYWLYRITLELKQTLNETELRPGKDLVLSVLTCGLWAIYAQYRNAQLVHRGLLRFDPGARDQSAAVLFLNVAAIVVLVTWPLALYILQQEMNRLGRFADRGA